MFREMRSYGKVLCTVNILNVISLVEVFRTSLKIVRKNISLSREAQLRYDNRAGTRLMVCRFLPYRPAVNLTDPEPAKIHDLGRYFHVFSNL